MPRSSRLARLLRRGLVGAASLALAAAATGAPAPAAGLADLPQQWTGDDGHSLALGALAGHRVVLTMAYVECHRICPTTIHRLTRLQHEFDVRGEQTEFVIIDYDPQAGAARAWRHYRAAHGLGRPNWHFLVGSPDATSRLARQLGFPFWKYDDHVVHESRVIVFDQGGAAEAVLGPDDPDRLAVL